MSEQNPPKRPADTHNESGTNPSPSLTSKRWIDMTEEEKKAVIRIRNAESARRSRQNKRQRELQLKSGWEENEKRIESLEKIVDALTDELQSDQSTASKNAAASSSSKHHAETSKKKKDK